VIKFIAEKLVQSRGILWCHNEAAITCLLRSALVLPMDEKIFKENISLCRRLSGQAAAKKMWWCGRNPDDYLSITSGILGEQKPKCILMCADHEWRSLWLAWIAGMKKFDPSQVKFVQELSVILARTIFNIKVNERTRKLYRGSTIEQRTSGEARGIAANAEEMQATQENSARTFSLKSRWKK